MTNNNWNSDDYVFEFPDVQRYEGLLIDMPIIHKIDKVRHFLVDNILTEAYECINIHAELPAIILGLASVDYLS